VLDAFDPTHDSLQANGAEQRRIRFINCQYRQVCIDRDQRTAQSKALLQSDPNPVAADKIADLRDRFRDRLHRLAGDRTGCVNAMLPTVVPLWRSICQSPHGGRTDENQTS
jgi:hypothetical protein